VGIEVAVDVLRWISLGELIALIVVICRRIVGRRVGVG
jgi:hypothetical protein